MHKTHIRTYRSTEAGDITVTRYGGGQPEDRGRRYEDVARDRRHLRLERALASQVAGLDVFRFEDDQLCWPLSPNGQDVDGAVTVRLLLTLFLDDLEREAGGARCL